MAQKNRNRRPMPTRRILNLEALEDRTLLSGNVTAVLGPTGILTISGDIGNNSISIFQAANGPYTPGNDLRVAGNFAPGIPPDVTSVNGVQYADFQFNAVTSININMTTPSPLGHQNQSVYMGQNHGGIGTVYAAGMDIPGNLTFTGAANANDTFSTTAIQTTNMIKFTGSGTGGDNVTMQGTNAGAVMISTGTGASTVSLTNGQKIGSLVINTNTASTANDSITVAGFPSVGTVSGIGMLNVTAGNGNNTINVGTSTFTTASITTGTGSNNITFSSPKVVSGVTLNDAGGGTVSFDNTTAASANVKVGKGPATVDASGNTITGTAGLIVNVGTAGNTATDQVTVNNNTLTAANAPLTVNVLDDGPQYWTGPYIPTGTIPYPTLLPPSQISGLSMTNNTVTGAATVSTGNFFRTVNVGLSAASLSATIGDGSPLMSNSQTVAFNTNITGAETINVGNSYPLSLTLPPISVLPPATFALNGTAGSLALTVGNNFSGSVSQNAAVTGTQSVSIGTNAGAVTVARPSGGNNTVTVGDNSGPISVTGTDTAGAGQSLTENITVGNNSGPITIGGSLVGTGTPQGTWTQNITAGNGTATTPESILVSTAVTGSQNISVGNYVTLTASGAVSKNQSITAGSHDTLTASGAVGGNQTFTIGDMDTVNASGAVGGNLTVSSTTGNGDVVNLSAATVGGTETITLPGTGNTVTVSAGTVGSGSFTVGDNANITVTGITAGASGLSVSAGNNAVIMLAGITSNVDTGNAVYVNAGTNASIAVDTTTANNGTVFVNAGDDTAMIAVTNTTASSMNIMWANSGTGNDTPPAAALVYLANDNVGTGTAVPGAGLTLTNTGGGNNYLEMFGLNVLDGLMAMLGSGVNTVFAGGVVADFGFIDGGSGGSNVYYDMGGNLGYFVFDFAGLFM